VITPVAPQLHQGYVDFVYNVPHILSYSDGLSRQSVVTTQSVVMTQSVFLQFSVLMKKEHKNGARRGVQLTNTDTEAEQDRMSPSVTIL
jgi:hypothetical protein